MGRLFPFGNQGSRGGSRGAAGPRHLLADKRGAFFSNEVVVVISWCFFFQAAPRFLRVGGLFGLVALGVWVCFLDGCVCPSLLAWRLRSLGPFLLLWLQGSLVGTIFVVLLFLLFFTFERCFLCFFSLIFSRCFMRVRESAAVLLCRVFGMGRFSLLLFFFPRGGGWGALPGLALMVFLWGWLGGGGRFRRGPSRSSQAGGPPRALSRADPFSALGGAGGRGGQASLAGGEGVGVVRREVRGRSPGGRVGEKEGCRGNDQGGESPGRGLVVWMAPVVACVVLSGVLGASAGKAPRLKGQREKSQR